MLVRIFLDVNVDNKQQSSNGKKVNKQIWEKARTSNNNKITVSHTHTK